MQVQVWLRAKRLDADKVGEDALPFEIDADRGLTAGMLVKVVIGKLSGPSYDRDSSNYEVRYPSEQGTSDAGGMEVAADTNIPELDHGRPIPLLKRKVLVIVHKSASSTSSKRGSKPETSGREGGRMPTLSQLSPQELEDYTRRESAGRSTCQSGSTCIIRLAISPLCTKKLVGAARKSAHWLAPYIPWSMVLRSEPTMSMDNMIKFFLASFCAGYQAHWRDYVVRKTNVSAWDAGSNEK